MLRHMTRVAATVLAALSLVVVPGTTYAEEDFPLDPPSPGPPGWFVALFVLAIILGIGTTVWRVSAARSMARRSGMDEGEAAAMSLLTDNGLEATYVASQLRDGVRPPADDSPRGAAARLAELQSLRDQGLVTPDEYAARRAEIIGEI